MLCMLNISALVRTTFVIWISWGNSWSLWMTSPSSVTSPRSNRWGDDSSSSSTCVERQTMRILKQINLNVECLLFCRFKTANNPVKYTNKKKKIFYICRRTRWNLLCTLKSIIRWKSTPTPCLISKWRGSMSTRGSCWTACTSSRSTTVMTPTHTVPLITSKIIAPSTLYT